MDFQFLVMEKSWKILFGKKWSPWLWVNRQANSAFRLSVVRQLVVIRVITWITWLETIKRQTDRDCACGCLAVRLPCVCGLSLHPIGCTFTLACAVQRYCSCSCRLWRYITVMPLPVFLPFTVRCLAVGLGLWLDSSFCWLVLGYARVFVVACVVIDQDLVVWTQTRLSTPATPDTDQFRRLLKNPDMAVPWGRSIGGVAQ